MQCGHVARHPGRSGLVPYPPTRSLGDGCALRSLAARLPWLGPHDEHSARHARTDTPLRETLGTRGTTPHSAKPESHARAEYRRFRTKPIARTEKERGKVTRWGETRWCKTQRLERLGPANSSAAAGKGSDPRLAQARRRQDTSAGRRVETAAAAHDEAAAQRVAPPTREQEIGMTLLRWFARVFGAAPAAVAAQDEVDFRSAKTVKIPRPRPCVRPAAPSPVLVVSIPRASRLRFKQERLRQRLRASIHRL